ARRLARHEAQAPLARCASSRSDQAICPHEHPLPPRGRRLGEALNQIAEYRCGGCAVKEYYFIHRQRSAKDRLINVGDPRSLGLIVQDTIEVQLPLLSCEAWWPVDSRVGPALRPFGQKEMVQLVGRN